MSRKESTPTVTLDELVEEMCAKDPHLRHVFDSINQIEIIVLEEGGVEKIRKPRPHKFRDLRDPDEFANHEDSGVHHSAPRLAWLAGAPVAARRP